MTDYAKLVEALRCGTKRCGKCSIKDCGYFISEPPECDEAQICDDAADAIEELQTDLKACRTISKCRLQGWKENELICEEQAKTLESIDILNKVYLEKIRKLEQQIPKHGEWIDYVNSHCECSVCHTEFNYFDNCTEDFRFCPNCGAKMGVQDGQK